MDAFRALRRGLAAAVLRWRGMLAAACDGSVFFRVVDAEGEKAVIGDEQAKRTASSSRRHSGAPLMVRLSSASFRLHKVSTTLLSAAPLAVRLCGKGRSEPSARCAAALRITS